MRARADSNGDGSVDLGAMYRSLQRVLAREQGIVGWLRALPTEARIGVAVVAVAGIVIVPRFFVHIDRGSSWTPPAAAPALVYGAILIALLWAALWPLQLTRSRLVDFVLVAAGLAAPFGLVDLPPGGACGLLTRVGYCFFVGTAVGWGLLLLLRTLDRGAHQDPLAAGVAIGVVSLAINWALQFDCPETGAAHRLVCHATIGVSLGMQYLGVLRWLEWRARSRASM